MNIVLYKTILFGLACKPLDVRLVFAYAAVMGGSRRQEGREIADAIDKANRYIANMTLGAICTTGLVMLDVACYQCPRRGRYRVTRLIDRHGARIGLPELKDIISGDCSKHGGSYFDRCGAYFPGVVPAKIDGMRL